MFEQLSGLATVIGVGTTVIVEFIKKAATLTNWLGTICKKLVGGWKTIATSVVTGGLVGIGSKAIILAGGLNWLMGHDMDFSLYTDMTWGAYAVAGLIAGVLASGLWSAVKNATVAPAKPN